MQYAQPIDFVNETDELKAHSQFFIFWPRRWASYTQSHTWQLEKLEKSRTPNIPDVPGIYTLILAPGIAGHGSCSYLMYVGQAKSLRIRFGTYLGKERRELGRPKVIYFLNKYDQYVWFCYTPVSKGSLDNVENGLILAYLPPLNDEVPGEVGKSVRAFR